MEINESILTAKESTALFRPHQRYFRSTHLERDWEDPSALEDYTYTAHAQQSLSRLLMGLKGSSSLRAWRITGDYGSGKSSFALLVANILNKRVKLLPNALRESLKELSPSLFKSSQPKLLPILITGSREPLGFAILKAIIKVLVAEKVSPSFYSKLGQLISETSNPSDDIVIGWLEKAHLHIIKLQKADGIALIIDEAGKFLEYAATNSDRQDIHLLQSLAELASRSGSHPFYIISILHLGLSSYAESLPKPQQREWEKVAGRFEEIIWHYPVEQTVTLIANSLNTDTKKNSKETALSLQREMRRVLDLGWYGIGVDHKELVNSAIKLYPIHPLVIPVLVKLFANFGQNERSLYSFLLGTETFGLQEFVYRTKGKEMFGLHNLYDYARSSFGSRLANLSYHWKAIESVVSSFLGKNEASTRVLKTIGVINLINSDNLVASDEILETAFGSVAPNIIQQLQKGHIIHFRGQAGGYCVWPNTSVNLEESYSTAKKTLSSSSKDLKAQLRNYLETRPIVARRHYIETGNLRFFEVKYIDVDTLEKEVSNKFYADGRIIVPLCETHKDVEAATKLTTKIGKSAEVNVLIVLSTPLQELSVYLDEVRRWEWIERTVGELRHDRFAREEVTRQLHVANQELQRRIQTAIGLTSFVKDSGLTWYRQGQKVSHLDTGKDVMSLLSEICSVAYPESPRIQNELINRRELSAAAAAARLRLCERLFEYSDQAYLGMDPQTHPPEMSMYLSVLQEAGLHREANRVWGVSLPDTGYDHEHANILPVMNCIHRTLSGKPDKRVPVLELLEILRSRPYGVRNGMIPLFLAVFSVLHEQEIAFYEDGSFIPRISGSNFLRLIKSPETFDIQYYPISSVRSTLFHRLAHELEIKSADQGKVDLLDVVKNLVIFIAGLPEYVTYTSNLQFQALEVRRALQTTKDPVKLLFHELPVACGLKPISENSKLTNQEIDKFASGLRASVDEMRGSYFALLNQMEKELVSAFLLDGKFDKNRRQIAERAKSLAAFVTEIRIKSFCLRLADTELSRTQWLESFGNLICAQPPAKWRDKDVYKYEQEVIKLVNQFLRVEATVYSKDLISQGSHSVRVSLTRPNGEERDQVIHLSEGEATKMQKLEKELDLVMSKHGQIGIAAASNVLWQMLGGKQRINQEN